jgi:hypothetical protein
LTVDGVPSTSAKLMGTHHASGDEDSPSDLYAGEIRRGLPDNDMLSRAVLHIEAQSEGYSDDYCLKRIERD